MDISLISNSGIQFHKLQISLDLNDVRNKMYFHEWFDTNENKLKLEIAHFFRNDNDGAWVRKRDLARLGYLKNGKPTHEWEEIRLEPGVNEIPQTSTCFNMSINKCKIENFENKWLPFPYFEINRQNDTVFGPINWCRVKLIPTGITTNNIRDYNVVIAYDTRTIYEDVDYIDKDRETPIFANKFENTKNYALCKNEFKLIDFCSENYSCEWVNKYILQLIHNSVNINTLNSPKFTYLATYIFLIKFLQQNCNFPEVKLYNDRNVQWCNVDLVIDIGNSKTSAVLFEEGDFTKVKTLELQDLSDPLMKYDEPFDMRLAFHKAKFGDFGIVDSKQFVYPSFVRLGNEGNNLIHNTINDNTSKEKITTFSSPKRYLWDKKQHKIEWEFVQTKGEDREPIWLNGISQQFNNDGSLNLYGNGGRSTAYSRCSLMTFAFLEILSQARMQINSFGYRDYIGDADKPRKIKRIIITCPTAMSKVEQTALRKCAEEAAIVLDRYMFDTFSKPFEYKELAAKIKIIPSVKNLSNSEERLEWTYDEATCSQFVFLYAEISKRYLNNSKEYFDLYGKIRKDLKGNNQKSLTIGSIDIGAGTTDLMICAYEYNNTGQATTLKPIPLFWESFYYAGDDLLKEFVHQFVIEGSHGAVKNKLIEMGKSDSASALLFDFFGTNHAAMTFRDRQYRNDFNLQVSIPVALKYLELAQQNVVSKEMKYEDIFNIGNEPNEKILTHFENHFGFPFKSLIWPYNAIDTNLIITKTFGGLLQKIAGIMYAYSCDFVLLAGRPTSLKQVEDLILKFYPVSPNRLITLNKYRVGTWYPFQIKNGYFKNQKSIVAIGAMIGNVTSTQGGLTGFSLDLSVLKDKLKPTTEYFGLMNEQRQVNDAILTPTNNSSSLAIVAIPAKFGCRQLNTESYPTRVFYILDFNSENIEQKIKKRGISDLNQINDLVKSEKEKIRNLMPLTISIVREDYQADKEALILDSVNDNNQDELPLSYFSLQIQSLNEPENFWLDSGEFLLDN